MFFYPNDHFPMYICSQEEGILYIPAELSGGLRSLGFLKICPIFLSDLKIIRILCLFNILPIQSVVPLTYGRTDGIPSSETVVLSAFIVLIIFFFVVSVFL